MKKYYKIECFDWSNGETYQGTVDEQTFKAIWQDDRIIILSIEEK